MAFSLLDLGAQDVEKGHGACLILRRIWSESGSRTDQLPPPHERSRHQPHANTRPGGGKPYLGSRAGQVAIIDSCRAWCSRDMISSKLVSRICLEGSNRYRLSLCRSARPPAKAGILVPGPLPNARASPVRTPAAGRPPGCPLAIQRSDTQRRGAFISSVRRPTRRCCRPDRRSVWPRFYLSSDLGCFEIQKGESDVKGHSPNCGIEARSIACRASLEAMGGILWPGFNVHYALAARSSLARVRRGWKLNDTS